MALKEPFAIFYNVEDIMLDGVTFSKNFLVNGGVIISGVDLILLLQNFQVFQVNLCRSIMCISVSKILYILHLVILRLFSIIRS